MFHGSYEEMVRFASQGSLTDELRVAKAEFVERTGELFESDASFERRLAAFLEWYVLDRPANVGEHKTPGVMYTDSVAQKVDAIELKRLRDLSRTVLSLFEFKKVREEHMHVVDMLTGLKHEVFERRKPAGLETNDILEGRLVPYDDRWVFSEAFGFAPREARRAILKATKAFRKQGGSDADRIDLVHRVAYFTNRCERYKHVDPKQIFADL